MRISLAVSLLILLSSRPGSAAPPSCDGEGQLVLAGPDEPGERLVISGTVRREGRAVAGARVLVYHTDARGYYRQGADGKELGNREARLKATVCTGADGRYEVRTIRPAGYAGGGPPPHVHFLVWSPGEAGESAPGRAAEMVLGSIKTTQDPDGSERATFDLTLP